MKHFPLIWSGVWRKRSRTVLLLLSTIIVFLLFGLLEGVNLGLKVLSTSADTSRLWVLSRGGSWDTLPLAHLGQIERVAGVRRAIPVTSLRGYFRDQRIQVPGTATDVEGFFDVFPELRVNPDQLQMMVRTRNGALIGKTLATTFGWKVGDRISIGSSWLKRDGTNNWEFDVLGIFDAAPGARGGMIGNLLNRVVVNHEYFDEERAFRKGTVSQYFAATTASTSPVDVGLAIDKAFANSSDETLTQTETAGVSGLITQLVDLNLIVNGVCGAALFSLLLLVGNTMKQSVHERIGEFAVLKTIGYSDAGIFGLVLAEPLVVFVAAAPIGLALAWYLVSLLKNSIGPIQMPVTVLALGLLIAIISALACGLPPARRVNKLRIVDALANK